MACEEEKRIFSSLSQSNTGCCCRLQNKPYLPSCHSEHPPRPEFPAASNFPVWQTVCQIQNLACVLTCNVSGGPTEAHLRESHLYMISITNYKNCLIFYKRWCFILQWQTLIQRSCQAEQYSATLYTHYWTWPLDRHLKQVFYYWRTNRTHWNAHIKQTEIETDSAHVFPSVCTHDLCMGAGIWCMTIHMNTIFLELVAGYGYWNKLLALVRKNQVQLNCQFIMKAQ